MNLSPSEIERYSRQLILKDWSSDFQNRLRGLCVSCSSKFPATALYLAAAGIGKIRVFGEQAPWLMSQLSELNADINSSFGEAADDSIDIKIHHQEGSINIEVSASKYFTIQGTELANQSIAAETVISYLLKH